LAEGLPLETVIAITGLPPEALRTLH
jgi:hypothetical protein